MQRDGWTGLAILGSFTEADCNEIRGEGVTPKNQITGGCVFWFKKSPSAWLELGAEKSKTFTEGNEIGKFFLLLILPPYGEIAVVVPGESRMV